MGADSTVLFAGATATSRTGSGFWGIGFGAVTLGEPAAPLKAECGGRDQFCNLTAALGALADRGIGKFLAHFKLMTANGTAVLVDGHR